MVKSSRNVLRIGLVSVLCCAPSAVAAAAIHRDAVTSTCRRSDAARKYGALASHPPISGAIRHRGGGGGGVDRNEQSESFLKRHPFASAVTITTCNAVAADIFTQLIVQQKSIKKGEWDVQRTILLGAFGLLFQGCAQYAVVNIVWERFFPGTSPKSVLAKILGMNLLSDPLLFFPCFYMFQTLLEQRELAIGSAMKRYSQNCWSDWRNSWMVWFPGHTITYAVMAPHRRIPWMAFLSFFYMCILSFTRGGGGGASVAGADALDL